MVEQKKFPSEIIDLPSKGWYYDQESPLASGQVELKYLTAKEEDILTSTNLIQKGVVIDKLLQSLIVDKNIKYNDVLSGDKNAIMIAARVLGYGKDYPISITCPICSHRNERIFDLTQLEERKIEEPKTKGENSFRFTLPISKRVVEFKLLTHADEKAINEEVERNKKVGITKDIDTTLTTRLKHIIISIDGDKSPGAIRNFVDNEFLARDTRAFREHYIKVNPDIDMTFDFTCDECGEERRMTVPLGIDFFWPDIGV